ncbi:MAG: MlaD family protein [Flavobacterium sp.]|nr:MlaD family protein [Flavobacterium sp.]
MKQKNSNYTWKLGMFVIIGLSAFFVTIYFIGKSQNLFGSTFYLKSKFKNVSGLKVGNNVLLSGINIGTVKDIAFVSDSAVVVGLVIRSEIQQYIKTDAVTSIGSDGLMGDKVVTISPGSASDKMIEDNATIASVEAIEIQDLMSGLKKSVDNAEIITKQLSEFSYKINNGKGALSKVLTDEAFAKSIDRTLANLETGTDEFVVFTKNMNDKDGTLSKLMTDPSYANSIKKTLSGFEKSAADINVFTAKLNSEKGIVGKLLTDEKLASSLDSTMLNLQTATYKLNEIEEAAKHNFLLRGYFKKQEKAKAKKKAALEKASK